MRHAGDGNHCAIAVGQRLGSNVGPGDIVGQAFSSYVRPDFLEAEICKAFATVPRSPITLPPGRILAGSGARAGSGVSDKALEPFRLDLDERLSTPRIKSSVRDHAINGLNTARESANPAARRFDPRDIAISHGQRFPSILRFSPSTAPPAKHTTL